MIIFTKCVEINSLSLGRWDAAAMLTEENNEIQQGNTWGWACFRGSARSTMSQGAVPHRSPQFWGFVVNMPTPFDVE